MLPAERINAILLGNDPAITTFEQLANFILNCSVNVRTNNLDAAVTHRLRIAEMEIYYTDTNLGNDYHPDPFTHRDEIQAIPGKFYFHRQQAKNPAQSKFKGGTFKGLDITFRMFPKEPIPPANPQPIYGGILIRSVVDEATNTHYEGSCITVDKILALSGHNCIQNLLRVNTPLALWEPEPDVAPGEAFYDVQAIKPNVTEGAVITLTCPDVLRTFHIYQSPRVGLTLKKSTADDDLHCRFIMRPYRYTYMPNNLKKARCTVVLASEYYKPINSDEIHKLPSRPDWDDAFAIGNDLPYASLRNSALDKTEDICKLYGFWCARYCNL
jgi:hypothetical protein